MRNFLVLTPFVLVLACGAPPEEPAETVPPIDSETLVHYIDVQTALAADDLQGAKTSLAPLAEQAGRLGELAAATAAAEEINEMRKAFFSLSEHLIESGRVPEGYIVAHCPMAMDGDGADWVQKEGEIRNPYFGAAMLTCGAPVEAK